MRKIAITELAFRDAHQSLFATRMKVDDMLEIASQLDSVGFYSIESWGGATFDACIRYLKEDPFKRLSLLKEAMPKTPQQMLIRGQNLLGYRHYADDLVDCFVERAVHHGMDIFRIFDALNDPRNLKQTIDAVIKQGAHAQGTLCYTTSPFHNIEYWLSLATELESMNCHSICIKDMSGILTPNTAFNLVTSLKQTINIPLFLHAHATAGLSSMTQLKAIEAGIDGIDTAISTMSMTYSHSPTESMISAIEDYDDLTTEIDLDKLLPIASYFKNIRKKYAKFEGELKGVDARIIQAQVPGGMLTNMESQLADQGLSERIDEVIAEIPRVRKDLGYIPLVTPTSQIVGTQAVINITTGERYKHISKEVQDLIKGKYGRAPSEFNADLTKKILSGVKGKKVIDCRPADLIENEMNKIVSKIQLLMKEKQIDISNQLELIDAALIYALFPQIGLSFLEQKFGKNANKILETVKAEINKNPGSSYKLSQNQDTSVTHYQVKVNDESFKVLIQDGSNQILSIEPKNQASVQPQDNFKKNILSESNSNSVAVLAPLAGNVLRIESRVGSSVNESDVIVVLEAMKMEIEVKVEKTGIVKSILVNVGDSVETNQKLIEIE